ncbi:hypothetical protein ARMSODRAFT_1020632 [Armillaria solidipes]|uniref:Uncharacterized protein n=1 Tax=Armillaria solidipes TaxID=1076256 RepID=A0A2H3BVQ2_9AGAR|nr:hypothetical protein ARMSODRAFT_1020632 [Armillaria solidipes]
MASLFRTYKPVGDSALLIRQPMLALYGTTAVLSGTGAIIAQRLIEKKGLRRHDVRSPLSAQPSLLADTQFTRTVQLTFYGDATFSTACCYMMRPLEDASLVI